MPFSMTISTSVTIAILTTATLVSYTLWGAHSRSQKRRSVRRQLPQNLATWREPGNSWEQQNQIWIDLEDVFRDAGITLWPNAFCCTLLTPGNTYPLASGFGYATAYRTSPDGPGTLSRLRRFDYANPLQRAARTRDGHDVIIRVIVIGNEGHNHLNLLRNIATGKDSLLSSNHTLPMLAEFHFEDITFGIFPKVGGSVMDAYSYWAKNSVGDIVEMLMQMLEALKFIHSLNIAHRDAFHDNFVIQWHPESLATMTISPSRPRVYLIDFEVAVQFSPECPLDQCVTTGCPLGGSFTDPETYGRPHAPEFASGKAYSPFSLDVWQLGKSLKNFKSTIPPIDEILGRMTDADPSCRINATEALDRLGKVVHSMAPEALLIEPVVAREQ
ncbi:kinase-like domain-containing protein [Crassisporium funariophilum]|nr:kinase-like domain-containing protein [Crassisporium funariophilum]